LANFYEYSGTLKGAPLANIRAMRGISESMGLRGVLQVEMVPWHSPNLSDKAGVIAELSRSRLYRTYLLALENLISACPLVLSWSAGVPDRRSGVGVEFKANAMRLDLVSSNILEISRTEGGISQAVLWSKNDLRTMGIFVKHGSANLPANKILCTGVKTYDMIAQVLKA
jgi:hypothetical protein